MKENETNFHFTVTIIFFFNLQSFPVTNFNHFMSHMPYTDKISNSN